jgi:hypothetical protein
MVFGGVAGVSERRRGVLLTLLLSLFWLRVRFGASLPQAARPMVMVMVMVVVVAEGAAAAKEGSRKSARRSKRKELLPRLLLLFVCVVARA